MRAFICILETAPSADVVDENAVEVRAAEQHVAEEVLERLAAVYSHSAAALVRVGANDGQAMSGGVISDCVLLVLCRVFLLVGGHAHVLRCSQADRIIASETVFVLHDRSHQSATVDRDSREFSFSVAYRFRANMVQMLRARPRE